MAAVALGHRFQSSDTGLLVFGEGGPRFFDVRRKDEVSDRGYFAEQAFLHLRRLAGHVPRLYGRLRLCFGLCVEGLVGQADFAEVVGGHRRETRSARAF